MWYLMIGNKRRRESHLALFDHSLEKGASSYSIRILKQPYGEFVLKEMRLLTKSQQQLASDMGEQH